MSKRIGEELNILQHPGDTPGFDRAISHMVLIIARSPGLSRTAMRLFVVLAGRTNRMTGYCYPGVSTLAKELCVSPQAIRKACRELEYAGFIHVECKASIYRTNVYYIDFRMLSEIEFGSGRNCDLGEPATSVSGPLSIGVFGETTVSGPGPEDEELLKFASEWSFSHG